MNTLTKITQCASAAILTAGILFSTQVFAADSTKTKQADKPDVMQVVRGAKAWKENCGRCHNLRSPKELTDEEWDIAVTHMRVRANLLAFEAEDIKAFLKASN